MGARRLQYLSRMGVDVFRRRERGGTDGVAEPSAQAPAAATESDTGDAAANGRLEAHWVAYDACVVVAEEPSHLIEDVVRAFAGEAQGPPRSEPVVDAADLARRLTAHEGVALVFGEALARSLFGEFVPHDIGALGTSRCVCALSPAAYADEPTAKRHLWRALCRLSN